MKKLQLIRGRRILDQLTLEEATYAELERNTLNSMPPTDKRQNATPRVRVDKLELVPARESGALMVKASIVGEHSKYHTSVLFEDVIYDDADQADNVTFTGSDNNDYHIEPIELARNNVKVNCSCLDFYWRFATWNHQANSLDGDPPPPYVKRTTRPPVNPAKVPGVCKHILKTIEALQNSGVVK